VATPINAKNVRNGKGGAKYVQWNGIGPSESFARILDPLSQAPNLARGCGAANVTHP
jgi:hypothetical protein